MPQELVNKGITLKDVHVLKLHDIATITGQKGKYVIVFSLSYEAMNNAYSMVPEIFTDSVVLAVRTKLRWFRSIEQAFQLLDDANLLKKFTVELTRSVFSEPPEIPYK